MTFKLPSDELKKWSQTNDGYLFGTLAQTSNITLDRPGILKLSKRARSIYDDTLDADFGNVRAIVYHNISERYSILTAEKLFHLVPETMVVTEDAEAGAPTVDSGSDELVWQSSLYVSGATDLQYWNGSIWQVADATTTGGALCVFENKNSLCLAQSNTVKLYDTSHSVTVTLTLPSVFSISSMAWANNYMYIGTRNRDNGEAMLFLWDGDTTAANFGYSVGTIRIGSVKAYKDSVALTTSDGQLLKFSGGAFDVLGNFPSYFSDMNWDLGGSESGSLANVTNRGMIVESSLIFILVNSAYNESNDDDLSPNRINNFPSGIWCYDPEVGLYHFASISGSRRLKTNAVTTANVNTTTDVITVAGATVPATGTPVMYDDAADGVGTGIVADGAEINFRRRYYTIYVSDTTFKIASTYANAIAGTAMDITGTGNNSQFFIFLPNRDFGGSQNASQGGIGILKKGNDEGMIRTDGMRLIFGGQAGTTTTSVIPVLCVLAEGQENRGYFITPRLNSDKIKDTFQNVTIKFRNINTPEDKILVKYRTVERYDDLKYIDVALTPTGTWTDANTFTSTDARLASAKAGDEVEIVRGSGAGYLAHISSISINAGTYTVNLDEDVQNVTASDTMLFFVDNWQRAGQLTNIITTADCDTFTDDAGVARTGTGGVKTFSVTANARWLQLKIELRGEDVEIEEILINNMPLKDFIV